MTQRKLIKALQDQKSKTQQTIQEYYGTLGIKLNGEQLVNVPGRSNYVYVKMRDNQNEVIQAFNNTVATSYDLPVILRREGTRYSVLGVNTARYQNTWNVVAPYLPNHGNTHSFSDSGGGDISWMFSRQFMPALVYPTSVTTGTNVFVGGYNLLTASNVWKYVGNTGTLDLLSYKPTGSMQSQMVLIYLDTVTGNPGVLTSTGSYLYNYITGSAQVLPYIPAPSLPSSQIPLAGVRLDTGTMSISWDNLYDIRQWIHATPSGTSSGGGGSGVDTIGFAGLAAGVPLGTGTMLNVVGAGATFTRSGTMFNLNIPGGGGGGGVDQIGIFGQNKGVNLGTGTVLNINGSRLVGSISGTVLNLTNSPDPIDNIGIYGMFHSTGQGTGTSLSAQNYLLMSITGSVLFIEGYVGTGTNQLATGDRGVTNGDAHDHIGGDGAPIDTTPSSGWIPGSGTWTCISTDSPIFNVSINNNATGTIGIGNKIWGIQSGNNKYSIVHGVGITGSTTYLNLYGGTDFSLVTGSFTSPFYSREKAPFGFPLARSKWTVSISNTGRCTKNTPSANTWYGDTGLSATGPSISVPIGAWNGFLKGVLQSSDTTVTDYNCYMTLSNASNSESDSDNTVFVALTVPSGTYKIFNIGAVSISVAVTSKTTYYLNIKTSTATADSIEIRGDVVPTIIKLTSDYL